MVTGKKQHSNGVYVLILYPGTAPDLPVTFIDNQLHLQLNVLMTQLIICNQSPIP